MEPTYKYDPNNCMWPMRLKPITEKKVIKAFKNAPTSSEFSMMQLDKEGPFSAKKIAESCTKVLENIKPRFFSHSPVFDIKCKIQHIGFEPHLFVNIFKLVTNIDLQIDKKDKFFEGVVDDDIARANSKLLMKPIKEKHINALFKGAHDQEFSPEKLAELCTKVLGKSFPAPGGQDAGFSIKYKIDKLNYILGNDLVKIDPEDFVKIFKAVTNIDLEIKGEFLEGLMGPNECARWSKLDFKSDITSLPSILKLLESSNSIEDESLKPILIEKIFQVINKDNFVYLATTSFKDESLGALLYQYLVKYSDGKKQIDLSPWSFTTLIKLNVKAKEVQVPNGVYKNALMESGKKIKIDEIIDICGAISSCKCSDAKGALVSALKNESNEMYQKLREGKDGEYKEHNDALNAVLQDIDY